MYFSDIDNSTPLSTTELNNRLRQANFGDAAAASGFIAATFAQVSKQTLKLVKQFSDRETTFNFKPANA
jgi:hypothetical protein